MYGHTSNITVTVLTNISLPILSLNPVPYVIPFNTAAQDVLVKLSGM